jgi:hypothetical protein
LCQQVERNSQEKKSAENISDPEPEMPLLPEKMDEGRVEISPKKQEEPEKPL